MKAYTGIGSRETPKNILSLMTNVAHGLALRGWTLRSGGADGADSAFERGAASKEIYLPWPGFNQREGIVHPVESPLWIKAHKIARSIHPAWDRVSQGGQKLHARNVFQVLGNDLKSPSQIVICWTPQGEDIGGTRTALVLARKRGIRILNLFNPADRLVAQGYCATATRP